MPNNFKVVIPNKLYRSGLISPSEIPMLINGTWNVKKIISLDLEAGTIIQKSIPKDVEHIIFPIELGGNASVQGRKLADAIKQNLFEGKTGAVLVHCMAGRDRTGMAIAMYRTIKQGWNCTQAIEESKTIGFGVGIQEQIRKSFELEICRTCRQQHKHYCEDLNKQDVNQVDDIVDEMRNNFSHQQGWNSAGAIPPSIDPQHSFAPLSDYSTPGEYFNGSVNIINASKKSNIKARKKILKRIIKLIEKRKKDINDVVNVGQIDNYNGFAESRLGLPNSAPGAPNAAGYAGTDSTIQL